MNRRGFLKHSIAIAPLIIAFDPLAGAKKSLFQNLSPLQKYSNRKLVIIELNGGNDGLNTIIPIDKYNILSAARSNILIPENKILKLSDTNIFGLHPSMSGLQRLYNDKLITIVNGVGYPNSDKSHFRGINIKYTANTDKEEIRSGWLGRYMQNVYTNYPSSYPLEENDGPPAIRIGAVSPKITLGNNEDFGVGIASIFDFNDVSSLLEADSSMTNNIGDINIAAIRAISKQTKLYAPIIQKFAKKKDNLSKLYPENGKNPLADQLKMVAKLIGGGLNTPIYVLNQCGYDTHGDQVEKIDSTLGKHADLLRNLSEAILAFQDDLHLMGKEDEVVGMTFSEFGRRISSTDSYGTDHGTSESVILFGSKLKNGIIGSSPDLPTRVTADDNLLVQYDFRSLYESILTNWLGVSENKVKSIITQGSGQKIDLIKT